MYCRDCNRQIEDKSLVCIHCGVHYETEKNFSDNYGSETQKDKKLCIIGGVLLVSNRGKKTKVVSVIFAIILGIFGAHKIYLGYTAHGIITLVAMGWCYVIFQTDSNH